jgi:hypothetical protein
VEDQVNDEEALEALEMSAEELRARWDAAEPAEVASDEPLRAPVRLAGASATITRNRTETVTRWVTHSLTFP